MNNRTRNAGFILAVLLLITLPAVVSAAAPAPEYTTTYTITVKDDGSAIWQIEYRTPLESDADLAGFETYTRDLSGVYEPQVQDLMQRSATQASVAASRSMKISNVTGSAVTQLSPTGKFGIVVYTFTWEGFAKTGGGLTIGDAFFGGLYLAKDSTLIIHYPDGYSIVSVDPAADQQRNNLMWYGQRSFAPGEPRIILSKKAFPIIPLVAGIIIVLLVLGAVIFYRTKKQETEPEEPDEPEPLLTADEQKSVEDRILRFLAANGGEQYQSDIVKILGLPRSTVSASLNSLHKNGRIVKVRKGRENLIRLVKNET
jgi:uncharacterized membrane protein